jgi:hypothetical protein
MVGTLLQFGARVNTEHRPWQKDTNPVKRLSLTFVLVVLSHATK